MPEITPSRWTTMVGWDDVPHLSAAAKEQMLRDTPPYLREARSTGVPSLGAGAIYPIPWDDVSCAPFRIPEFWPRAFALDVGWNRTAALWGAWNPADLSMVCWSEHYRGEAEPAVHAASIKARGAWIPGVIDPAARGRAQQDGEALLTIYRRLDLRLIPAENAVESGLYEVWSALDQGRIKFFSTLTNLAAEYRIYRRDERGQIVKKNDHLMDCLRYLWMSGRAIAKPAPSEIVGAQRAALVPDARAGY